VAEPAELDVEPLRVEEESEQVRHSFPVLFRHDTDLILAREHDTNTRRLRGRIRAFPFFLPLLAVLNCIRPLLRPTQPRMRRYR
jgi:hypothetical protein